MTGFICSQMSRAIDKSNVTRITFSIHIMNSIKLILVHEALTYHELVQNSNFHDATRIKTGGQLAYSF